MTIYNSEHESFKPIILTLVCKFLSSVSNNKIQAYYIFLSSLKPMGFLSVESSVKERKPVVPTMYSYICILILS